MGSSLVDRFEILLEHDIDEQYQYEPGQVIRGNVILKVNEALKVKAIQVQVQGEATVSWDDTRADETYIDVTQSLLKSQHQKSITLEKGKHQFPLEYALPLNLPSSFIGKFGSITYVVKATLKEDQKFGLNTMITSEPFLVMRRLDLTASPEVLKPYSARSKKRLWGALAVCVSGSVEAELSLQKTGFVPGEDMFIDAEVHNESPRLVKAITAAIIMHSTFSARTISRSNVYTVNKKRDELEMSAGDGHRWRNVRLTVPPYIPETRLDGCDIIDVKYELLFRVEVSGGNELKMVVPIVVGTTGGISEGGLGNNSPGFHSGIPNAGQYVNAPRKQTPNPQENGETVNGGDENDNVVNEEDLIIEGEEFRYPMTPGDTKSNPIFFSKKE